MTAISIERNKEQFNHLPDDFQQAIRESNYDKELETITKKHRLHIDQSAKLESLLAKLIFGEIESSEIISAIESGLNIEKKEAIEIGGEISVQIIEPIKRKLREIQTKEDDK